MKNSDERIDMLSIRTIDYEIPVIVVQGEIKAENKNEVIEAIRAVVTPARNSLILDLTGVEGSDAEETYVIIEATQRTLGAGGKLALVVSDKGTHHALKEARVADNIEVFVFEDREKAMDFFAERGQGIA